MILNLAKQAVNKLGMISKQKVIHAEPVNLNIAEEIDSSDSINVPDIKYYLNSEIERLDYFGIQELRVLDNFFCNCLMKIQKLLPQKYSSNFFPNFLKKPD